MPIAYLDVPAGADRPRKEKLVKALYEALSEAYPYPDDTRIFIREWLIENTSQNGVLGWEPARPVFTMHVPKDGDPSAQRKMMKKIHQAVADAYGLPEFITFMHEHSLDTVAVEGNILADDQKRVEEQRDVYAELRSH